MTSFEIAAVEDALVRWSGAVAYIWSYGVSHRRLTLRMQRQGEPNNVHIVCTGCSYLQGKPLWPSSNLSFEKVATNDMSAQYALHDELGQFRALFTHATVEFDVAPIHAA